jgi:hypothetical protein
VKARYLLPAPAFLVAVALLRPMTVPVDAPRAARISPRIERAPETPSIPSAVSALCVPEVTQEVVPLVTFHPQPTLEKQVICRVAQLLELACLLFRKERYSRCREVCERIRLIDPDYAPALDIGNVAARLSHGKFVQSSVMEVILGFERETDDDSENPRIPEMATLQVPDPEAWSILDDVAGPAFPADHPFKADPLESKVDLAFQNCTVAVALEFLRDSSGLKIVVDADVLERGNLERTTGFRIKGVPLKHVLRLLLAPLTLDYSVTEEGVVLVTAPYRLAAFAVQN